VASVRISENSSFAIFSLEIENEGSATIEAIHFPHILHVSGLGENYEDDNLVIPSHNGRLINNPTENLDRYSSIYPSGFQNMQFIAYYDDDTGFYFATYDENANTKSISWIRDESKNTSIEFTHFPIFDYGSSYILEYDVIIGSFNGDWYTAADIYRKWAHERWWCTKEDKVTWLPEIGVSTHYSPHDERNMTYEDRILKNQEHQKYFDTPILLSVSGWENGGAWSYGNYFPPKEGWEKFDEVVTELHKNNTRIWLFISGHQISTESESWLNGTSKSYAILGEEGSYIISEDESKTALMCPYTDYWKEHLKGYVKTLAKHGVDVIQLDGFPWLPPEPCLNTSHGHPPSLSGNQYSITWLKILNETKEAARSINPQMIFSGEGGAEIFIPFLDLYHSRDSMAETFDPEVYNGTTSVIPLFDYVYHNHIVFVSQGGAPFSKDETASLNRLAFSRKLVWGEISQYSINQPFGEIQEDPLIEYIKRCSNARSTYAQKFLSNSTPVKPEKIPSPSTMVEIDGLPWVCEEGEITGECIREKEVPSLQYGAWKAYDGSIGYIMTNIADSQINLKHEINTTLPVPYLVYLVKDGILEYAEITHEELYDLDLTIEPLEIVFLMFAPPDETSPKANAGSDIVVPEDTTVVFDGSGSTDNQGIVDYTWTFKDRYEKITLKDVHPSYNFKNPGSYVVALNVTDAMNNFDIDIFEVHVMDTTEPVARAGPNRIARVDENIIFDASQSTDNVRILSYEWDFGDGINRTFPIEIHSYTEPGTYNVTLKVKDWVGNIATDTVTVTVEEKLPRSSIETHGFLSWISTGGKLILILIGISFAIFLIPFILLTRSSTKRKNYRKHKRFT